MNIEKSKEQKKSLQVIEEIGSEFWINSLPNDTIGTIPKWLSKFGNIILTSSGRGAITLLLEQISPINKSVLLPGYICESVILPFLKKGYTCYFYEINRDLSPNIESICSFKNIGIFLHMGYFGRSTNSNLINIVEHFKEQSTIVIEDITHTLFSNFNRIELNDFYVGSIRKWFGLPSGGFLSSFKRKIKKPLKYDNGFSKLRTEALLSKGRYIKTKDDSLKDFFLNQFSKAESILDKDMTPYSIDSLSMHLINLFDVDEMVDIRKKNFELLEQGLRHVSYLEFPFDNSPKNECPFFFPVIISKDRDHVRKELIDNKIYCPVHWPLPIQIKNRGLNGTLKIYDTILSIPCDQRYSIGEMQRIITLLTDLDKGKESEECHL